MNFFKMLSDETRLRILILLYHRKFCVCQICGIMEESQPKISKHLAKLRDMGFVKDERQEQFIFYSLNIEEGLFSEIIQNIVKNINDIQKLKMILKKLRNQKNFFNHVISKFKVGEIYECYKWSF